ncbi:MAG: hypothetical protein Q8Q31_02115 [Nanoarchaeota archaeon]|nr:hypothetical protein [Nanoarchaeota archaeon]
MRTAMQYTPEDFKKAGIENGDLILLALNISKKRLACGFYEDRGDSSVDGSRHFHLNQGIRFQRGKNTFTVGKTVWYREVAHVEKVRNNSYLSQILGRS